MEYTYDQMFQRNIGVFTQSEQDIIRNLKVSIIGVGGLGAPTAENLARLGVNELRLVEPDVFEISNMNRQTGAYIDTLNRNKAEVIAEMINKINPSIIVNVKSKKIYGDELEKFIEGSDIIVDGIDFFNISDSIELHKIAKKKNIPIVSAQGCISMISFSVYDPNKSMLSDLVLESDELSMIQQATNISFPILPAEITSSMIKELSNNVVSGSGSIHIPSYSVLVPLSGAITTQLIINFIIKKQNIKYVPIMPKLIYIDNNTLEIKRT